MNTKTFGETTEEVIELQKGSISIMKTKLIILFLISIIMVGCNNHEDNTNKVSLSTTAELFITKKGYKIVKNEGYVYEYILEKKHLTEMPYLQYWSVQTIDPVSFVGKRIKTSKFIVKNHPLDNIDNNRGKQTNIYIMETEKQIIGGYSLPVHDDLQMGWVYTIDGKTLEELTGMPYQEWLEQWKQKYEI
ncbi:hypothetical protein [Paenibacillus harenae]|uniref:DUF4825 domain-containing protein n=1 Tax=Paenibacillus harenae TaxID=306543 RepID=A0ABT9TYJ6_PAEHA|nr:hypothetical protein [Paenibacillus harenae]MDQ0112440.1 hypothetical protein [Paenibacillus harenae]